MILQVSWHRLRDSLFKVSQGTSEDVSWPGFFLIWSLWGKNPFPTPLKCLAESSSIQLRGWGCSCAGHHSQLLKVHFLAHGPLHLQSQQSNSRSHPFHALDLTAFSILSQNKTAFKGSHDYFKPAQTIQDNLFLSQLINNLISATSFLL